MSRKFHNVNGKDLRPIERLNAAMQDMLHTNSSMLEGKILTIVDASYPDRDQREAIKSLVRQAIWNQVFPVSRVLAQFTEKFPDSGLGKFEAYDHSGQLPQGDWFRD